MKLDPKHLNPHTMTKEDLIAFRERYGEDPVRFVHEVLGLETDDNQKRVLNLIRDRDYVAVGSGRGIGKTYTDAMVALWVLSTRPGAKVMMLANTDAQSRSILWPPLITIMRGAANAAWFDSNSEAVWLKGNPEYAFIKRVTWSEHSVESVSGFHSHNMLYIMDEASKMPNVLIENLYASCTESWNKMLLTSNPTRNTGYFYETASNPIWTYVAIDSRTSRWTDKGKIQELVDRYGEESDVVRVQVRGLFPRHSSMSIVPEALITESMTRVVPALKSDIISIGLDLGGGGDPTVWLVRAGYRILEIVSEHTIDDGPIIQRSVELVDKYHANRLIFDRSGLGGMYLAPRLQAAIKSFCKVEGRVFGEASPEQDCFNMRAWMYRRTLDWFKAGGSLKGLPQAAVLGKQLLATEYIMTERGQRKLIPKDLIREAIGSSPDEADALALSCAYPGDLQATTLNYGLGNSSEMSQRVMADSGWST